jgi:hypothetical protein
MPADTDVPKSGNGLPLLDPNSEPLKIAMESKCIIDLNTKPVINLEKPCKIKYNPSPFGGRDINVTGQIVKNYRCRIRIDTGCPVLCMLSYNVVKENNLSIYSIEGQSPSGGICYLPYLHLGEATIRDIPCLYLNRQWELQFFGIPVNKIKLVLFGLQLMKEFRYILFDNVRGELTLSAKQSFTPMQDNHWLQYPFKIEENIKNRNIRLIVDLPIEENTYRIALDTGADAGLIVDTRFFDRLPESMTATGEKQNFKLAIYPEGWLDCKKMVVPELNFCHRKIKNAQVIVLPDDTADKYTNFVGMQYFKDTVFVLDFESELLWVKD